MEKDLIIKDETEKTQKKKFEPLSTDFLRKHNLLTEGKIQVIEHPARKKTLIGAKKNGKNYIQFFDALIFMEQNPLGHVFGFRKTKDKASEAMGSYFFNVLNIVEKYGYKTRYKHGYDQRKHRVFNRSNYSTMRKNTFLQFAALDDVGATEGGAPHELGFYGRVLYDEVVNRDDMLDNSKIPTKEWWAEYEARVESNLDRFNDQFKDHFGKKPPIYTTYYAFNDYGKHPESEKAQAVYPRDEFLKDVIGFTMEDLLGNKELILKLCKHDKSKGETVLDSIWGKRWMQNSILSRYHRKMDHLVTRITAFDNPHNQDPEKARFLLEEIASGFVYKNFRKLAIYAGLQYKPEVDSEMLAYNIKNFNTTTFEKLLKERYVTHKISYGLDIDSSRVLTLVPIILMKRANMRLDGKFDLNYVVFIDQVKELSVKGTGDYGELIELQAKHIAMMSRKHFLKIWDHQQTKEHLKATFMQVDDARKEYLKEMKTHAGDFIQHFSKATKNGHYEIDERQDLVENAFKNGVLLMHEKNTELMEDFNTCVKADLQSKKRKTSGSTNYLDRIDPTEYGIYPFVGYLKKPKRRI